MNTKILLWPAAALLGLSSLSAQAVPSAPDLFDYGFNVDGSVSYPFFGDPVPANVNTSLFDDWTGLGTITAKITGVGAHSFDAYFDHDVGAVTGMNEIGSAVGATAAGQSWEIDRPPLTGDIDINFEASTLDNSIGSLLPDDVAMAMGWDFTLGLDETAEITLLLSDILPASGFYLIQNNMVTAGSNYVFYLSSAMSITGGQTDTGSVPEPSILLLMGLGLAGMVANRRKERV